MLGLREAAGALLGAGVIGIGVASALSMFDNSLAPHLRDGVPLSNGSGSEGDQA
jgi:hypothetical protein